MKKQVHKIAAVRPGSIAEEMEIESGDILLAINEQEIEDIFDFQYQIENEYLEILIRKGDSGEEWLLEIEKEADEDLGIDFENGLMDDYKSCRNKCVFCFIDQMPAGMRDTLYFKDDDSRLSFLQGNYVTLTNMSMHDIDRIIEYRLGPINISFHTTNPELRRKMLKNRYAGDIFGKVRKLADSGIELNGQIVLCKGLNDGNELDRTIRELEEYLPALKSLSVVPVGLTKFRDGLEDLKPFDREDSLAVIKQIETWQEHYMKRHGIHFVQASDEWYLTAGLPMPEEERYDGFIQLENGVGMLRLLDKEIHQAVNARLGISEDGSTDRPVASKDVSAEHAEGSDRRRSADSGISAASIYAEQGKTLKSTIATGYLAAPFITKQAKFVSESFAGVEAEVVPIRNDFFGHRITVSGLITGQDLIGQLRHRKLGDQLLIPCNMLRYGEEVFLDDITLKQVEKALHIPIRVVDEDGESFVKALLGEAPAEQNRRQMYEQTDRSSRGTA